MAKTSPTPGGMRVLQLATKLNNQWRRDQTFIASNVYPRISLDGLVLALGKCSNKADGCDLCPQKQACLKLYDQLCRVVDDGEGITL